MESFYQEMLNEIETLIQSQNIQEAIKKIEFELSMPYVPSDVEAILQQHLQELKAPTMTKKLTFDDEAIEAMLKGNEKEALIAIDYLREVNIHRYLDMIQEVFQLQTSRIVIVSLIDALMKQMLATYPKNYLKNRANLRFYLPSDLFDDYIDAVGQRATVVGDDATGKNIARPYKGIPVVEAPVLNDAEGTNTTKGYGKVAMLMDPNNMCYGIFHEVGIEPDRQPKLRKTDYVFSAESGQGFENPNVGVVALYDMTKPSGS
jgi:hypothetical protein